MKSLSTFFARTLRSRSIRALPAMLALTLAATSGPASAQEVGRTTVGTLPSSGLTADFKRGSKFTVTQQGVLEDFCFYIDGLGGVSGSQTVRFAAYKDANGVPGQKILDSFPFTENSGWGPNWNCVASTSLARVVPGNYWLVMLSGATGGVIRDYADGTGNWYGNADNYSDGPSDPFGPGNAGNGTLSIYSFLDPSTDTDYAGRLDIAKTPSGGLSANYKRGSQITFAQSGRVVQFVTYLDSLGGATGSQDIRLALYTDDNGKPGTKVAESSTESIAAGTPAHWYSFETPAVAVTAGKYWLMLHTGNTAGVLRDYGDGPANFYANADTFSDGASQTFGAGNAGTVTLSGYVSYTPGPYYSKTFGRTDIASTPSGGMTANFKRGSFAFVPCCDAVLTGLYAYLDGRGGASGSQQLRMALYTNSKDYNKPERKLVESEVVTIPAGTAPGWVHFPVQPTRVSETYGEWIVIESGDTGGVARNYGDASNGASWRGNADTFADGGSDDFGPSNAGTVTLSLYGTYETRQP